MCAHLIKLVFVVLLLALSTVSMASVFDDRSERETFLAMCEQSLNRGFKCSVNKPVVKWHFDAETATCLAFAFNGCGGNTNRFDTPSECRRQCIPMDFGGCALMRKPAVDAKNGRNILCGYGPNEHASCPAGHSCVMGAFFGLCCNNQVEELFERNARPKRCFGNGRPPVQTDLTEQFPSTLLGKSCANEFCPAGSVCKQQEIFAHCCPI